jgi:hypothetical protein
MRPLKTIIAVALLLCLFPLPYGYYELVRLGGMVCFAVLAYQSYQQKQEGWMVVYAALALLFQPFFKIALGRGMWNMVDVSVAGLLLWTVWKEKSK